MRKDVTIVISKELRDYLNAQKVHSRQSYNEVLYKLLSLENREHDIENNLQPNP